MTRILTALVLIPAVVWIVLYGPTPVFLGALAVVGILAHREFDSIAAQQGIARSGWFGAVLGVAWLLAPDPLAIVLAAVALAIASMRRRDLAQSLPGTAVGVLGIVYIFGAWRCAIALRSIDPHWLMIAMLVSWAGDTAAMYVGKSIGKRKLAPRVSPAKTWAGAVGSVIGGTLAAVVYAHYLLSSAAPPVVVAVGAVANIAGQLGDLAESAFKRGAGVKDSGASLPGHGGWLDRIDSSLFSVPATYALVRILT